jgi:hypothetical protein
MPPDVPGREAGSLLMMQSIPLLVAVPLSVKAVIAARYVAGLIFP